MEETERKKWEKKKMKMKKIPPPSLSPPYLLAVAVLVLAQAGELGEHAVAARPGAGMGHVLDGMNVVAFLFLSFLSLFHKLFKFGRRLHFLHPGYNTAYRNRSSLGLR